MSELRLVRETELEPSPTLHGRRLADGRRIVLEELRIRDQQSP